MNKIVLHLIVVNLILGIGCNSQAQTFKVKKLKGHQALIEITQGDLEMNQEYSLKAPPRKNQGDRGMLIGIDGFNFAYTSKSSDTGTATSTLSRFELGGNIGWNMGHFEAGPSFAFISSTGGTSTSYFGLGGFLDYNFQENKIGQTFIWGLFGDGFATSQDAAGAKTTGTRFDVGAFAKWFPLNEWLCFRANLKAQLSDSKSDGVAASTKETSFILNGGVAAYF